MAKLLKNDKGFKVLSLTENDTRKVGWGLAGSGRCLCMRCNEIIKGPIIYPVVLNDTMCSDCYKDWLTTARNYPEDRVIEQALFSRAKANFTIINEE